MTPTSSDGSGGGPSLESRVRQEVADREDVRDVRFRDVTPKSVEVEIEEETDGGTERLLYRVEREPRPESDEVHLHWTFLGSVSEGGQR